MAVKIKPDRKDRGFGSASVIEQFSKLPENITPRRFNVEEYYRMAEVGILGEDDYVELIEGQIIDKSSQPIGRRRFTVEEYYRMAEAGILREDERVELIEGEILEMSPIGRRHAACVARLDDLLRQKTRGKFLIWPQNPVQLNDLSKPQPDIAILKKRKDYYAGLNPAPADVLLIVEVADTTVQHDRTVKAPLYARAGIPEVWLVDLPGEAVEIYARPEQGEYQTRLTLKRGESIISPTISGLSFSVESVLG